ncbi:MULTISPECIES: ribonuclease H-like YkuK family protein [Paenibacillus]|uniref:Ribonuclease H-like YkuK family protein n=2 Tax=Paenibacillus TaxID=44249 RepID=A0ABU6DGU9_9BACL|nr:MULTISPECIES: ribonuclease H-like YkuK family protein [Paenibacillus]MCY9659128.1 ribonuclease H-like YkuK family protein [Paenibacillus anseongense]MEB4796537.1 ribonuclease H-like YkuK family protein [Paenibacillus chondroitinus]
MKPSRANHPLEFRNTTERGLNLDTVHERILHFMRLEPAGTYKFIIGTDCQVHSGHTKFITGVVIQRLGKGAWACYRQVIVHRALHSIKEKLSMETALSEEIATYFDEAKREDMENIVLPHLYQGASFDMYIHIDAGDDENKNRTAKYVQEMVRRVESVGMVPVIKPDCYVASAYANRFSKKPYLPLYEDREVKDGSL